MEGGLPKKGEAWTVCKFKGGLSKKEGSGVINNEIWLILKVLSTTFLLVCF